MLSLSIYSELNLVLEEWIILILVVGAWQGEINHDKKNLAPRFAPIVEIYVKMASKIIEHS